MGIKPYSSRGDPVPVRRVDSDYDYAVNEAARAAVKDTGAAPGPVVDPAVDPVDWIMQLVMILLTKKQQPQQYI